MSFAAQCPVCDGDAKSIQWIGFLMLSEVLLKTSRICHAGSNVVSVAEHVVMQMLALVRNYIPAYTQVVALLNLSNMLVHSHLVCLHWTVCAVHQARSMLH